ncbi:hypothetical protein [Brucella sp. IR073]|uniref:hypothetical protein n=1 Tax=unclassified Brucella TaxID=2632610 RepID=UPI003B980275
MKKITISMDDELAQRISEAAANAGKSISSYLADAGKEKLQAENQHLDGNERRRRQREALQRIYSGPMWDVTENGRMPTSEERNALR